MEGIDHFSSSNPFATEEHYAETATQWEPTSSASNGWESGNDAPSTGAGAPALEDDSAPSAFELPAIHLSQSAGSIDQAKQLAGDLADILQQLSAKLDESAAERAQREHESAELRQQIQILEGHRAAKEQMVDALLHGPGGELSNEDVQTIQNMMDALKQDPDRLTVLFTVVQHAGQLATVISDYSQLRHLAEQV